MRVRRVLRFSFRTRVHKQLQEPPTHLTGRGAQRRRGMYRERERERERESEREEGEGEGEGEGE